MPQFNRVLVIVNPVAGQRNAAKILSAIETYFGEKGYRFVLRECKNPEDATNWARSAADDGFDLVAACGGDGTIREAADGIMKSRARIPLAQIPAGTTNFVARAMLIPMNMRGALEVIDTGKPMPFDIGYIPEHDAYFIFVAGAGYDATLIRETPFHLKKKIGFAAYVATGIKHASAVQPVRMDLELDGKVKHLRAHTIMAVNIGTISNVGFSFAPDVDPHDGFLLRQHFDRLHDGIVRGLLRVPTARESQHESPFLVGNQIPKDTLICAARSARRVTDIEVVERSAPVDVEVERSLKEPVELRLRQFQSH